MNQAVSHVHVGNADDAEYEAYLARVQKRFAESCDNGKNPLFLTNATGLWDAYLAAFPENVRQFHNCHACRRFVERFGALATISASGTVDSAIWHVEDAPEEYKPSVRALAIAVSRASIESPFHCELMVWGEPGDDRWRHLAVTPDAETLYRSRGLTGLQEMASGKQDYITVKRALGDWPFSVLEQATLLLKTEALYRAEKVLGQAQWLLDLKIATKNAKGRVRDNLVWLAVTKAPAGFCHPRSSMIGTLLDDLAAGKDFDDAAKSFAAKMNPLKYARPVAPPKAGSIMAAEKLVEKLGIAASLRRRYARLDEIQAVWRPEEKKPATVGKGVFAHLLEQEASLPEAIKSLHTQTMTWEKFARTVLPDAKTLELKAPTYGNYAAYVTAADPDAPPIIAWDTLEQRNPFSWYCQHPQPSAKAWGLISSTWYKVNAISLQPNNWFGQERTQYGKGALFVLDGCKQKTLTLCLFPELLKSELHSARAVIEAHSRVGVLEGVEEASACGLMLQPGGPLGGLVRVNGGLLYNIDRFD